MKKNILKETVNCIATVTFIGAALTLFVLALFTVKPWIPIGITCVIIGGSLLTMGFTSDRMNFTVDDDMIDGEEY